MLPFIVLLSRDVKRHGRALATVATALIVVRFVDLFWLVRPSMEPAGLVGALARLRRPDRDRRHLGCGCSSGDSKDRPLVR